MVVLFVVFKKHAKHERPFLRFVLRSPFFCYLQFSSCLLKAPQDPKEVPRELLGAPKDSPRAPLGALWAPNASRYLVFCVCVFCSLVSFIYCTSNTGSRVVNGQNAGPSARRESTFGRHFSQMPAGAMICRVFLPPLSFFIVLHCRHRSTPDIWPPKSSRAAPRRVPDCPNSSQDLPKTPQEPLKRPWSTQEPPRSSLEVPRSISENISAEVLKGPEGNLF